MATAFPHADRTASEARRPEAGSRAGGVSRAERGNDGSPTGARRRRWLDAQHDSATGHDSWPGTPISRLGQILVNAAIEIYSNTLIFQMAFIIHIRVGV